MLASKVSIFRDCFDAIEFRTDVFPCPGGPQRMTGIRASMQTARDRNVFLYSSLFFKMVPPKPLFSKL